MPKEGAEAGRRRLVFTNLVNGVQKAAVMAAFRLSEKEVDEDFAFVCRKLKSYRFERGMQMIKLDTIAEARAMRVGCLETLIRCNLDNLPHHGAIETLPFDAEAGRPSLAEQRLLEVRIRAGR